MLPHRRFSPAFHYVFRVTAIVFTAELAIMLFFYLVSVENIFYQAIIDSVFLIIILLPALHRFVYLPMLENTKLRNRLQKMCAREDAVLENSTDVVITCDSNMIVLFWNHMAEELFGYCKDEAIGKDIRIIVPEQYRQKHMEGFTKAVQKGKVSKNLYSVEGLRKDGSLIPIELSLSSYKDNEKLLWTAIIRDITERKQSEVIIKRQLARLSALRNIDMAITASLDLRVTLNVVLDEIFKTLPVDAADILLLNPSTLILEYAAGRGFRTTVFQHTHLRLGEGYAGKSAIENRVICIPNLVNEPGSMLRAPLLFEENFASYCCAPLISKGNIKGVVEVFSRTEDGCDQDILDFVEDIGMQASIAVDNASMFNNLQRSNIDLRLAYDTTMEGWAKALDLRDKETEGHSRRVADITVRIAREMGMDEEEIVHMRRGALLHDIGKMGIPDNILLKAGKLNNEEWTIMRNHTVIAHDLLSPIPFLRNAIAIPYYHHEKWDGTGYPKGLKGEDIPLPARIFSIVDVWDALCSDRPYRHALDRNTALEHIKSLSGINFDPKVVDVFLKIV